MRHQLMQRLRGTAQLTCILGNAADPAWILLAHGVDGFHAAGDVLGGGGLLIHHQGDFLCGAGGIRLAHACMDAGDGLQGIVSALTRKYRQCYTRCAQSICAPRSAQMMGISGD